MHRLLVAAAAATASAAPPLVQLDAWGRDSIRVRIAPPGGAIVDNAFSPYVSPPPSAPQRELRGAASLTAGNLAVTYDAATGFISASRVSDGAPLLTTASLTFGAPAAGSRAGSVSASLVLAVAGGAANRLYGLGEHGTGRLDMTGYDKMLQTSQYYSVSHGADILIPYYMAHPLGLGVLWAQSSYGSVSLQPAAHNWTSYATLNVDLWLTTTPAPADYPPAPADPAAAGPMALMLRNYVDAVGHAPPMPSYVAGFWQSKNRYRNQSQVLDVARGYRERGLPLDIITIDYMHWNAWGDWSFNTACFPDPAGMVEELLDMGVELAVTFWPYLCPGGAHFANFSSAGLLATARGTSAPAPVETWACDMYLTDETNPAARAAIYAAFREGYGRLGVRTVWLDGSEPERSTADNFGQFQLAGGTDSEVGEGWILQHVRALAEGFAADGLAPDEFMLLPRSTWAGAQRHSAAVWSGDISSDFATLAQQIVVAQGMGLSGHALWTNDGGGYAGGDPRDPTFQALIVRWLQASAFFPIMRLHGQRKGGPPDDACGKTGGDNELWNLAADAAHYEALAAAVQLRADLREYTLRINRATAETGLPMVRAMVLAFPGDAACAAATPLLESQWMYGPDWLVAPVLSAGAASRDVYLPDISGANATWVYHWNGSDCGSGGAVATVNVSDVRDFPLFVRTPLAPPPPRANVSSLWSAARNDSVTCVSALCYADQQPDGGYAPLYAEGAAFAAGGTLTLAGAQYALVPLTNYWSASLQDNAASLAGAPDASYDVAIDDGFVLATQAPGSLPLRLFVRNYSAAHVDTAALASPASIAWAAARGYADTGRVAGFVLTEAAADRLYMPRRSSRA